MKDIILKITGKTLSTLPKPPEGLSEEDVEFTTTGKYASRGNITYISYEETELSGMDGCTTSFTITPGKVKMVRSGNMMANDTVMEFEEGKRYTGNYVTPFGSIGMEVLTSKISSLHQDSDGTDKMSIDYAVSLKGLMESHKILNIQIIKDAQ